MSTLEQFYDLNPVSVIDTNLWDFRHPEVVLQLRRQSVYTPLVDWTNEPQLTGARGGIVTELLEGDTNADEIPMSANYIDALGVDSRARTYSTARYGGKVQLHRSSNIFQMWKLSGPTSATRDWRPLLRGILGYDVVNKIELLARNIFLRSPATRLTYGGNATSFNDLGADDTFHLESVIDWNFRLGNTGSPVIPGDMAMAKVAIIPPGVEYDVRRQLASASQNEAAMFRDAHLYSGQKLNYEIGTFSNVRFVTVPNDKYGLNKAVLYNAGAITKQYGVTERINMGDGAPDPETTKVDDVWAVGQKNVTHFVQLEDFEAGDFAVNDIVTIHTKRTNRYGVTNGVDPLDGTAIHRRVVGVDPVANRLSFDRPVMANYHAAFTGKSVTGNVDNTFYAYLTKAKAVGFVLVLGSRGGALGATAQPLAFYEPRPVDDFESVWRYTYDMVLGHNIWEPNYFECHFCSVSLPRAGGIISP